MTTNQTIDGMPREWLENYAGLLDEHHMAADANKVRALLDSPAVEVRDRCGVQMVNCPECTHQWDHFFECGNKAAAQPQGEPVAFIQIPKNIEKYGHGDQADRLKFGKPGQFFANGESPMFDFVLLYAEQPAPVAVASRDESIAWLKRIDGIGQARAELIYSMGFRRHTDVPQS